MPYTIPASLDPTNDFFVSPYVARQERVVDEVVDVYRDPYFETEVEASGVILKRKLMEGAQRELWRVQLPSGMEISKWLKKKEIVV